MPSKALLAVGVLAVESEALRKTRTNTSSHGAVGGIDGLYTFGAPGVARGGVENARGGADGCFPGIRAWTWQLEDGGHETIDLIVPLARTFGFRHPLLSGIELDISNTEAREVGCSDDLIDAPRAPRLSWDMHSSTLYADSMGYMYNELYGNLTYLTTRSAKELDPELVALDARERGWRLVGTASHDGSWVFGGPQSSHLLQNPDTLECMITFRGSMSARDYFADALVIPVNFCGFEQKFHKGFRDHFRRISRTDGWRDSILPALPSCSKFYSTGHSLGGAVATLFAACVQKAPQEGEPGYDDYQYLAWTKGTPKLLPELFPAGRASAKFASFGAPGEVDGLYTFGAPGVAGKDGKGIKNARAADGCFPGIRAWTFEQEEGGRAKIDVIVPLARTFGFRHPHLSGIELDNTKMEAREVECSSDLTDAPRAPRLSWDMHSSTLYADSMGYMYNELYGNLTYLTTRSAKELDPEVMAQDARERGWRLVATAYHDGSWVFGGPQSSHVLQNPDTLECMITFRGSMSVRDYFTDALAIPVSFCGYEEKFHKGFRDHFRRISRTVGWQESIRPALSSCSKFYSTGHSLGGAVATIFAACVQKAPQPGQPGYEEDFKYLEWKKGTPKLLPELHPANRDASRVVSLGAPGEIEALYTFGAPGVAEDGIKNPRAADGCFPGVRAWTWRRDGLTSLSTTIDLIVPLARTAGYRHPMLDGVELDTTNTEARWETCSRDLTDAPRSLGLSWAMHSSLLYADSVRDMFNDLYGNLTYLTTRSAKYLEPEVMAQEARERGWRLVGTAYHDGNNVFGGPQSSHLLQNPETLECMVTFRGSMSVQDYMTDALVIKSSFCGFTEKFHRGFRDHFRRISRTEGWQNSIRPALPSCSKFYSTGHSLGGAMATVFAACVQKAPQPGEPGYDEDYVYLGWTKGTPKLLPEWTP